MDRTAGCERTVEERLVIAGRCPNCCHLISEHRRIYIAEGGSQGHTFYRCTLWVRGHKCRCSAMVGEGNQLYDEESEDGDGA